MVARISVGPNGHVALVDDDDFARVSEFKWNLLKGRHCLYAWTGMKSGGERTYWLMHRLITGYGLTDHINGDGLDNRRSNLRPATLRENGGNRRKRSGTSVYKGVSWDRLHSRWRAQIKVDIGRTRYLGIFESQEDAARKYDEAARLAFGEYAALNFPNEGERGALERGA